MTKEQIKAIIKQYADKGKKLYRECCDDNESASLINYWDGYRDCAYNLLRELEDVQEEPVSEDLQKAMYLDENGNPTPAKETEYTKGFLKGANWQLNKIRKKYEENRD